MAICSLVNQTDVIHFDIEGEMCHGTVAMGGNRDLLAEDTRGITVRVRRGNQGSVRYALMYVDAANKEHALLASTPCQERAGFIAASIREILGLEGEPISPAAVN